MFSGWKPSQLGAQPTLGRGPGRLPRLQHHPPPPTNSSSSNSSNLQIWIHRNICIILVNISSHLDAWICHPEDGYNNNNLIQHPDPDPDLEFGYLDIWNIYTHIFQWEEDIWVLLIFQKSFLCSICFSRFLLLCGGKMMARTCLEVISVGGADWWQEETCSAYRADIYQIPFLVLFVFFLNKNMTDYF